MLIPSSPFPNKWKGKHDNSKPMGCGKSSYKREVYRDKSLCQEQGRLKKEGIYICVCVCVCVCVYPLSYKYV